MEIHIYVYNMENKFYYKSQTLKYNHYCYDSLLSNMAAMCLLST